MKVPPGHNLQSIAKIINAKMIGDEKHSITGINEIHMVEAGDLCFVDHPKYYDKCLNSAATTILINQEVECPAGKALLISSDPFRDYNKLVNFFQPFSPALAAISDTAEIGEGTVIQPGVYIGSNVSIGRNCLIHANVVIHSNTVIGNQVVIGAGSVIGGDAFYFKRRPEAYDKMLSCGRVVLEDQVELGSACTIDKGVSGDTIIGFGSKLDNQIHIGHDTHVGKHVLMAAQCAVAGVTKIEDEVILWGQVGVQKDLVIGKGAIVLAQSGVSKSLEGGKVYFGYPAEENRTRLRELAALRQLPDFMISLKSKLK